MLYEHFADLCGLKAQGLITARPDSRLPLVIYNYTAKAQYAGVTAWTDTLKDCRGLILDQSGEVIARPFRKFFNADQVQVPVEPFEVYEKLDGSLIVAALYGDELVTATRGSFDSEQANMARSIIEREYGFDHFRSLLESGKTYCFELIHPKNRIVVDYRGAEELVLLAVLDTDTGRDCPLRFAHMGGNAPRIVRCVHSGADFGAVKAMQDEGGAGEGFVVRFASGFRAKMKFAEYVRLHRLVTQCSARTIWENISTGKSLDELLEHVPDEFYGWVRSTESELRAKFDAMLSQVKADFAAVGTQPTRKDYALAFQKLKNPSALFAMLDGNDPAPYLWKLLRPENPRAYYSDAEAA